MINEKTILNMVIQMIDTDQFSQAEEDEIRKALAGKAAKKDEEIFSQYISKMQQWQVSKPNNQGNAATEKMQEFFICPKGPDAVKCTSHVKFERDGIRFIDNPYTIKETETIREWVEDHPNDVRGLAAGLWLSGGLSPQAILNLKTDACWGGTMDRLIHMGDIVIDRSLFQRWDRFRIVKRAIDQHQKGLPYVFMFYEKNEWHKLNGNAIQIKMFHICRNLDITYKRFSNNEIILFQ